MARKRTPQKKEVVYAYVDSKQRKWIDTISEKHDVSLSYVISSLIQFAQENLKNYKHDHYS